MSIQLFQSLRSDLSVTSFPHHHVWAQACEPIAAAGGVLVWFPVSFPLRHERSTKSHEASRTTTAQSKTRFGRHFVIALSCVAVLISMTSIAGARQTRVEIRVLPNSTGRI